MKGFTTISVLNDIQATDIAGGRLMADDPKEERSGGLRDCLWFKGPVLMDHVMPLQHDVNQINAASKPTTNRVDFKDSSNT